MLKTRIIGVVPVKNGIAVQSIGFKKYLPIGKPEIAINYLDKWGVDEIIVLKLDGHQQGPFLPEQINRYAKKCHVPLAVGGGVCDLETVKAHIRAGADKIVLNSVVYTNPALVTASSDLFGQQCVIVSIDAKKNHASHTAYSHGGRRDQQVIPVQIAENMQRLGAGEIFLTSIDQDGSKQGYDLPLIQSVASRVSIPLIACGGAGHPQHALDAIKQGASAVAVGNLFHFTEHSVILFKKYLTEQSAAIRANGYVSYKDNLLNEAGRLAKHVDEFLDQLRFQYIPEETI